MFDPELYRTWRALDEAGRHEEILRMLEPLLEARPNNADLHLLLGRTFTAMERDTDSLAAVHRAIDCGEDDASVLTRAASSCFYAGDLGTARRCVDRAKEIMPRGFIFRKELKELDRNLARREKRRKKEKRLQAAFRADPRDREVATDYARHLIHTGRTYAAYHVVARGLHHHPDDRRLHRLEKRLRAGVPGSVRAEADQWAKSGSPS